MAPPTKIRIWADFTALQGEYLALDFKGSFRDIRRQKVELSEGLHIIVYDDTYQSEAIVEKVKGEWLAGSFQELDATR